MSEENRQASRKLYEESVLDFRAGHYAQAAQKLEKSIELQPSRAEAYDLLALVTFYNNPKDSAKALELIDKSLKLREEGMAYYHRATIHEWLKQPHKTLADLDKAVKLGYDGVELRKTRAFAFGELGKYKEALADCDFIERNKAATAVTYYRCGWVSGELADYPAAIAYYEKSVQIRPDHAVTLNNLGNMYRRTGKREKALELYARARQIDPDYSPAYYNAGLTYQEMEQNKLAEEWYSKALAIAPDDFDAHNNRANVRSDMNDFKGALEDYNFLLKNNPKKASVWFNRGNAFAQLKEWNKAVSDYDQALFLSPRFERPYLWRALAQFQLQELDKAERDFRQHSDINADWINKCDFKFYKEPTRTEADELVATKPANAQQMLYLADKAYQDKNYSQALSDLQKALDLNPKYPTARFLYALILARQGQQTDALQQLQKAEDLYAACY